MGLDYEVLKEINPKIIYCAVMDLGRQGLIGIDRLRLHYPSGRRGDECGRRVWEAAGAYGISDRRPQWRGL